MRSLFSAILIAIVVCAGQADAVWGSPQSVPCSAQSQVMAEQGNATSSPSRGILTRAPSSGPQSSQATAGSLEVSGTTRYEVQGLESPAMAGGIVTAGLESKPVLVPFGCVKITTGSENSEIRVKAENAKREKLDVEKFGDVWRINAKGHVWVEVTERVKIRVTITVVDQDGVEAKREVELIQSVEEAEIDFIIQSTSGPDPGPGPGPGPEPEPNPDVPEDQFDNLGQRVAGWAAGLPDTDKAATAYSKAAESLRSDPAATIDTVSKTLVEALEQVSDELDEVRKKIAVDLQERWSQQPMSAGLLSDYYAACAAGFRGAK